MNPNDKPVRQNKLMTTLVPLSLFEELRTFCVGMGKSVSQVQREMIPDFLARQGYGRIGGAEAEDRRKRLQNEIDSLQDKIYHLDDYMKIFEEQGGDTNEFRNAEATLVKMRSFVDEFQKREEEGEEEPSMGEGPSLFKRDCDPCSEEAWFMFVSGRHLEVDWLRFEKYILCKKAILQNYE